VPLGDGEDAVQLVQMLAGGVQGGRMARPVGGEGLADLRQGFVEGRREPGHGGGVEGRGGELGSVHVGVLPGRIGPTIVIGEG